MPHDPLALALLGLILCLQILKAVLDRKRSNGHLTEDKVRLIVAEEIRKTQSELRNAMQTLTAQILENIRDLRR